MTSIGQNNILLSPTIFENGLQISVHKCPRQMLRELTHVFPCLKERKEEESQRKCQVLAVLTIQRARFDLSQYGPGIDEEKDRLLENFMSWAYRLSSMLLEEGYWSDFIDPCSGLPMLMENGNKVYSEVDGVSLLLQYQSLNAGMCKILLHPEWGASMYPASLFTDAPFAVVNEKIQLAVDESKNIHNNDCHRPSEDEVENGKYQSIHEFANAYCFVKKCIL